MSTRVDGPISPIIELRDELVAYLEAGCKPKSDWRIGTEHEKFGFYRSSYAPVPYDGERGIRVLLEALQYRFGWDAVTENGNIIALRRKDCPKGGAVSLEPGGQLELSGAPLENVHETYEELRQHLVEVAEVGGELGIGFLGLGFSPKWTLAETPVMPKSATASCAAICRRAAARSRHDVPHRHRAGEFGFRRRGGHGRQAARWPRAPAGRQPRCSPTRLSPRASRTASSPTAPRCGATPIPTAPGCCPSSSSRAWASSAMSTTRSMCRCISSIATSAISTWPAPRSGTFLAGKLQALPGVRPTLDDWADHLTTLFPDVRLKRFLEMRGADAGSFAALWALPALWTGLLYDQQALDGAVALTRDWTLRERADPARCRPATWAQHAVPRRHAAGCRPRHGRPRAWRSQASRPAVTATATTNARRLRRWSRSSRRGARQPTACSPLFRCLWAGNIDCVFETQAF